MLRALEQAKLDEYRLPEQLLGLFQRMQDFQIKCASDLTRPGYRRRPYSAPSERQWAHGRSGTRRRYVPKIEPTPRTGARSGGVPPTGFAPPVTDRILRLAPGGTKRQSKIIGLVRSGLGGAQNRWHKLCDDGSNTICQP